MVLFVACLGVGGYLIYRKFFRTKAIAEPETPAAKPVDDRTADLKGASEVWQKVLVVAPASEEARAARQALDGLRSAHPDLGIKANPEAGQGTPKGQGL